MSYQFTKRWFKMRAKHTFKKFVKPAWEGKPITYLEVGVFEGMSLVWMMDNVLTHKDSRAVGIDPWLMTQNATSEQMEEVWERAKHNTNKFGGRCELIRGTSSEVLKMMSSKGYAGIERNSVDVCMIDGDHYSWIVLDDAESCLRLLKVGGWMIFDDVDYHIRKKGSVSTGLERFLEIHKDEVEQVWHDGFQKAFEKRR